MSYILPVLLLALLSLPLTLGLSRWDIAFSLLALFVLYIFCEFLTRVNPYG